MFIWSIAFRLAIILHVLFTGEEKGTELRYQSSLVSYKAVLMIVKCDSISTSP